MRSKVVMAETVGAQETCIFVYVSSHSPFSKHLKTAGEPKSSAVAPAMPTGSPVGFVAPRAPWLRSKIVCGGKDQAASSSSSSISRLRPSSIRGTPSDLLNNGFVILIRNKNRAYAQYMRHFSKRTFPKP